MKKVVLYLEDSKLENKCFENEANGNCEWIDEESEMSLFSSRFFDKIHDHYPSTGRMYVRMNDGNYVVRHIREEP